MQRDSSVCSPAPSISSRTLSLPAARSSEKSRRCRTGLARPDTRHGTRRARGGRPRGDELDPAARELPQLEHARRIDWVDLLAVDHKGVVRACGAKSVARVHVERVGVGAGVDDDWCSVDREVEREQVVVRVTAEAVLTDVAATDHGVHPPGTKHVEPAVGKRRRRGLRRCRELLRFAATSRRPGSMRPPRPPVLPAGANHRARRPRARGGCHGSQAARSPREGFVHCPGRRRAESAHRHAGRSATRRPSGEAGRRTAARTARLPQSRPAWR